MTYKVDLTLRAHSQLSKTAKYISEVLLVPETASKWLNTLKTAISKLDSMPNRHPLMDEEPWHSKGFRKFPVKGFFVYYFVTEETHTVTVTAVIYGKQDQITALRQTNI